ncbi:MAG: cytochrome c [Chloroflexi bacterium]|nr:cytochrome c [Chloroflexota bacterium]
MVRIFSPLGFSIGLVALMVACAAPPTPTPVPPTATQVPPVATRVIPTNTPALVTTATRATSKGDPARGAQVFTAPKIACNECHYPDRLLPGGEYAPNLGNIATEAERIIKSAAYTGTAKTAADYLRESILEPNVYIVPDSDMYRNKDGTSAMDQTFAQILTPEQIEDLIAYLLTLK